MGEAIDIDFIHPVEVRPNPSKIVEDREIPIIDLSQIAHLDSVRDQNIDGLVAEIGGACEKWGFFIVVNHGVPLETIKNLKDAAVTFLAQSKEEKRKVNRCKLNPMGYYDDEYSGLVRDWREGFDFAGNEDTVKLNVDPLKLCNRWPQYPPEIRDVALAYAKEVQKMVMKMFEIIALSLGLEVNRLTDLFKEPTLFLRFNHYMPCSSPELVLGNGVHTDTGGMTVVSEDDVGGLQVRRKSDGEWISVKPIPGSFVVNIGDLVQVWSNDKYESIKHRVVSNRERNRLSISANFGPSYSLNIKPFEEFVDQENPSKHEEFNYGEFRASLLKEAVSKPKK